MVQNRKKTRKKKHLIIHFPMSSGVSERTNEWAQRSVRAKRAMRSKRTSEQCERTSERTSEWPSTYVWVFGWSGPQCSYSNDILISVIIIIYSSSSIIIIISSITIIKIINIITVFPSQCEISGGRRRQATGLSWMCVSVVTAYLLLQIPSVLQAFFERRNDLQRCR